MSTIAKAPREFMPAGIAIITISDTRTWTDDKSGDTLVDRVEGSRSHPRRPPDCEG